eukprot:9257212-Ditylum_brightwellii.AAC.1
MLGDGIRKTSNHCGETCSTSSDCKSGMFDVVLFPAWDEMASCVYMCHDIDVHDTSPVIIGRINSAIDKDSRIAHVDSHFTKC